MTLFVNWLVKPFSMALLAWVFMQHIFAAGRRAKVWNAGSFLWADSTDADFASTADNQFAVRATGGVRFETGGGGLMVNDQPVLSGQVQASQLADGAVTALKFAPMSVGAAALADGAVTAPKLANDAASLAKVSGGAMVNTAGYIGIGTTMPTARLDIRGADAPLGAAALAIGTPNGTLGLRAVAALWST